MSQTVWQEARLDEIIAATPATVNCTDASSASRLRFALYRRLGNRKPNYRISVSGSSLRIEQRVDPILSIRKESSNA